jgi:hypothetical protein
MGMRMRGDSDAEGLGRTRAMAGSSGSRCQIRLTELTCAHQQGIVRLPKARAGGVTVSSVGCGDPADLWPHSFVS